MKEELYKPNMTWAEIARELNLSQQRVVEIYNNAIKKLRSICNAS